MGSGYWDYYFGNQVAYGNGGWFQAIIGLMDDGSNTGEVTTVYYRYSLKTNYSMNDSSNSVAWWDPWGSNSQSSSIVHGSSGGETVLGGPYSGAHGIQYGGGNTAYFRLDVSGLANGSGTSRVEVNYPLPGRAGAPPNPSTIAVGEVTATSAKVYATVAGAENGLTTQKLNYRVHRNSDGAHMGDLEGGYGGVYFTNLSRATGYTAYSQSYNAAGWGGFGNPAGFTTLPVAPTMAASYSAGSISRNSAVISGFSVSDNGGEAPNNIQVQYSLSQDESSGLFATVGSWNNATIMGLFASTLYYYRARAANSQGWGPWAGWKAFITLADAPSDMAPPSFTGVGDNGFTLSWVAPAMNGATFTNYRYEVSLTNAFTALVASGNTTATMAAITGLVAGTTYYARVRTVATPNSSGFASASTRTTGITPNSGMRVYGIVGGVPKLGTLYTFVGGTRRQLRPMLQRGPTLETE